MTHIYQTAAESTQQRVMALHSLLNLQLNQIKKTYIINWHGPIKKKTILSMAGFIKICALHL